MTPDTEAPTPKRKPKPPTHDELRAVLSDVRLPPEMRLALAALMYEGRPMRLPEVREAAGLKDRAAMGALRMARSMGRVVYAQDAYSLPVKS